MSDLGIGIASFPVLMALIFMRVPIGLAMFLVALGGLWALTDGWTVALSRLKHESFSTFSSYSLSIIPMFLLMGHFATLGGMSQALFRAAESWLGHRKGGPVQSLCALNGRCILCGHRRVRGQHADHR